MNILTYPVWIKERINYVYNDTVLTWQPLKVISIYTGYIDRLDTAYRDLFSSQEYYITVLHDNKVLLDNIVPYHNHKKVLYARK